ncbi:MAG: D-tyrosyl-tRNA(Tyr) deacylase [Clostridia bacterium]|nr:D-tyrosyl-tRNA(Tyr) deacylase [Clostridia bacterium]
MRLVIQRVLESSVTVEGKVVGSIGKGFMVLCGVEDGDTQEDLRYCVEKTAGLRIFEDEAGKMNRSILDVGGEILAVSQFTLHGDARHGRRPSFSTAARPELAVPMYEAYCNGLRDKGIHVETGIFQADMKVSLVNDGPVTLLLDSRRIF